MWAVVVNSPSLLRQYFYSLEMCVDIGTESYVIFVHCPVQRPFR